MTADQGWFDLDDHDTWYGSDGGVHEFTYIGSLLVYRKLGPPLWCPPPGIRNEVLGFSDDARFRMLKYVAGIDWQAICEAHFITLTYPDDKKRKNKKEFNIDRNNFARNLERRLKTPLAGMWRIEWKRRLTGERKGQYMPHFHLLTFGSVEIPKEQVWNCWERAIREKVYADVDCERMKDKKQAGIYVSKYVGKADRLLGNDTYLNQVVPGRQWGKLRKKLIPRCEERTIRLIDCEVVDTACKKALEGRQEVNIYGNESFTLLGPLAEEIGDFVFDNPVDGQPESCYIT